MFDPVEEKSRIYEMLSESKVEEHHYNNQQIIDQAVDFAMCEYKELALAYNDFFESVSHLVVFKYKMRDTIVKETINTFKNLREMISNEGFTNEELESMPTPVYNQVIAVQKERSELLKEIAKTYMPERMKNK